MGKILFCRIEFLVHCLFYSMLCLLLHFFDDDDDDDDDDDYYYYYYYGVNKDDDDNDAYYYYYYDCDDDDGGGDSDPFQFSLPNSQTLFHKSPFIPRTWNLWNVLPSSSFPESYNLLISLI